jgi:metal transporter CNNM
MSHHGAFNCTASCLLYENLDVFQACTGQCHAEEPHSFPVYKVFVVLFLVCCSAFFAGMTLGYLPLTIEGLAIMISAGNPKEKEYARTIMPLRKRGNLLLCTLLLGNTLCNSLIAIFSAELTSGLVGEILSTGIIVIFAEIAPQAACTRYGLRLGAAFAPIMRPLMFVGLPITYPISRALDVILGRELGPAFNRAQLDKLLEIHAGEAAISVDDQRLLSSALTFGSKQVASIMTPIADVFMISVTDVLDFDNLKAIYTSGYTRIPVYQNRIDNIVGIVFTKDLILVDPNDEIPVASILPFCSRSVNAAPKGTHLERLLAEMQASRSHLYFVTDANSGPPQKKLPRIERCVGIVTMEDLLEELISIEIIDEEDTLSDNRTKKRTGSGRGPRRLEFFTMLQRRDTLAQHQINTRATADEVRALVSYLSSNVAAFRPPLMSGSTLRKLVLRCAVISVSPEDVVAGRYVYVRGVPASFCCLLLHGRLQIRAGNEGFTSEVGPWTPLAVHAISDLHYQPDFTARVECASRILVIKREDVLAVLPQNSAEVSTVMAVLGQASSGVGLPATRESSNSIGERAMPHTSSFSGNPVRKAGRWIRILTRRGHDVHVGGRRIFGEVGLSEVGLSEVGLTRRASRGGRVPLRQASLLGLPELAEVKVEGRSSSPQQPRASSPLGTASPAMPPGMQGLEPFSAPSL